MAVGKRKGSKQQPGRPATRPGPAWEPAGEVAATPGRRAGLLPGLGRPGGRRPTRPRRPVSRPGPAGEPGACQTEPACVPDVAGREAGEAAERAGLGAGPGRR